jgi:hypothetical protein
LNDTIGRALTWIPSGHTHENRFAARFSPDNCPQTFGGRFGLFCTCIVHQQSDLSFAQHPRKIRRPHLRPYLGDPALR